MKISLSPIFRGLLAILVLPMALHAGEVLKINGSTTVNLPAAEAAEILRAEKGMSIQVDTQGGSSGGISMLGDGLVYIGMSSKPANADERAKYLTRLDAWLMREKEASDVTHAQPRRSSSSCWRSNGIAPS